jgi:toxin-antitoxin system PIN domain toxin
VLLDTNVLLALAWPNHQHHGLARKWFGQEAKSAWATCAVTELGVVRLSSNPAYSGEAVSPREAAHLLQRFCAHPAHRFWPSPPASRPELFEHAIGHQQVTDAWLVAAAIHNKGRLATLDRRLRAHDPQGKLVVVIA